MPTRDLRTTFLFVVLGLIGIISFVLSLLPAIPKTFQSALSEFAIGVFIAIVLAFTVDHYTTEHFNAEITRALQQTKESVFDAVFSTMLPESIYKEVRETILTQPFMRKNVFATISLTWPPGRKKESLLFTTSIAYDIFNLFSRPQEYTVFAQSSRPNDPKLNKEIGFLALRIGDNPDGIYTGGKLNSIIQEDDTHITLRTTINIRPGNKDHVEIEDWRYIETEDYYTLNMGYPTEGLTVLVNHPEDITVKIRVNHPSPNRLTKLPSNKGMSGWKLEGGIRPYQGLEIWWYSTQ